MQNLATVLKTLNWKKLFNNKSLFFDLIVRHDSCEFQEACVVRGLLFLFVNNKTIELRVASEDKIRAVTSLLSSDNLFIVYIFELDSAVCLV